MKKKKKMKKLKKIKTKMMMIKDISILELKEGNIIVMMIKMN